MHVINARVTALRISSRPPICLRRRQVVAGSARDGEAGSHRSASLTTDEWQQRMRRKARIEVVSAGPRVGLQAALLEQQLDVFESLLPNLAINLDQMRASDWARVVADPDLAAKLVMIKEAFPALNVVLLLTKHPRTLLWSRQQMQDNIHQVSKVFNSLPRPEVVLEMLPELLDPRQCFSVVATLRKWYPKRDPLWVLQTDPEVVRRAEQNDVPLEPVFFDAATSTWTAAGYSRTKQQDWQVYIEKEIYKRKPQPIDQQDAVVVGGSSAAGDGALDSAPGEGLIGAAAVAAALGMRVRYSDDAAREVEVVDAGTSGRAAELKS